MHNLKKKQKNLPAKATRPRIPANIGPRRGAIACLSLNMGLEKYCNLDNTRPKKLFLC